MEPLSEFTVREINDGEVEYMLFPVKNSLLFFNIAAFDVRLIVNLNLALEVCGSYGCCNSTKAKYELYQHNVHISNSLS